MLALGDILVDTYQVERVLGRGAMGTVYGVRHVRLGSLHAVKVLRLTEDVPTVRAELLRRFEREVRIATELRTEHVARVIDVAELDDGSPYLVMEYLDGIDLDARLRGATPMPVHEVVTYLLQVCEALAEAHARGIVHRDLKPSNVFLAKTSDSGVTVKLLDFGISKVSGLTGAGAAGSALTKTGEILGTPLYMAPEQLRASALVDGRADIWSLGIIAYLALSGRLPFQGDTLAQILAEILTVDPPPLALVKSDLPPLLAAAVQRCLAKVPDHRFATIADLAVALAPWAPDQAAITLRRIHDIPSQPRLPDVDSDPGVAAAAPTATAAATVVATANASGPYDVAPLPPASNPSLVEAAPAPPSSGHMRAFAVAVVLTLVVGLAVAVPFLASVRERAIHADIDASAAGTPVATQSTAVPTPSDLADAQVQEKPLLTPLPVVSAHHVTKPAVPTSFHAHPRASQSAPEPIGLPMK